jgi:hypothetical protein
MEYSTSKSSQNGVIPSKSYRSDRLKEGIEMKSKLLPRPAHFTFLQKTE